VTQPQSITVVGEGRSEAQPDVVVVSIGVEVTAASPADALDGGARALERSRAAVLAAGVMERAVQTTRVSVQPDWEHSGRRPVLTGYVARVGVAVTLDDPASVGRLLTAVVEAGGDAARVHSISWQLRDMSAAESAARAAAFTDARGRAEQYATLAGRTLGAVVDIDETGDGFRPRRHGRAMATYSGAATMDMDVDRGEVDVTATVTVTWELV
jgi:uncharacterized protein YggE